MGQRYVLQHTDKVTKALRSKISTQTTPTTWDLLAFLVGDGGTAREDKIIEADRVIHKLALPATVRRGSKETPIQLDNDDFDTWVSFSTTESPLFFQVAGFIYIISLKNISLSLAQFDAESETDDSDKPAAGSP